jgi:uncharacterized protein with HEPN domain
MSSGTVSGRSDQHRTADCLADIVDNIVRIEGYIAGYSQLQLASDELRRDAVERCLERICEAAYRLGEAAGILMPAQPWQDIRGMGNRLRHAYDQIDFTIVWNVVERRLPSLKADAELALERLRADDST